MHSHKVALIHLHNWKGKDICLDSQLCLIKIWYFSCEYVECFIGRLSNCTCCCCHISLTINLRNQSHISCGGGHRCVVVVPLSINYSLTYWGHYCRITDYQD